MPHTLTPPHTSALRERYPAWPRYALDVAIAQLRDGQYQPRRAGAGYSIRCPNPAHSDSTPSAAVYQRDDGRLSAYCYSACDGPVTDHLYAALGCRRGDDAPAIAIAPAPPPRPKPTPTPPPSPAGRPRIRPAYRPPEGAELIPGTGWPILDGPAPYTLQLRMLDGGAPWTAWVAYQLADGAPRYSIRRFPNGHRGWDADAGRLTRGLRPAIIRRNRDGAPYIAVEGEKVAAAIYGIPALAAYGIAVIPGTSHYATADYSELASLAGDAGVIIPPDADDPRRNRATGEITGLPVGWKAAVAGRAAMLDAGIAAVAIVQPLEWRRAARAAGLPVSGADAADCHPDAVAAVITAAAATLHQPAPDDAPAPPSERLPRPVRPAELRCTGGTGLQLAAPSVYGGRRVIPLECRKCAPCIEWRRREKAARFEAGRPAGTIGAVGWYGGLESPDAAADLRRRLNRYGGMRYAAIWQWGDAYGLAILWRDALDARAAGIVQDAGMGLENGVYITPDDVAYWTPPVARYYPGAPVGLDGWYADKPDGWKDRPRVDADGVAYPGAINTVTFSRGWRNWDPAPPDMAYGNTRLEHGAGLDAVDERVDADALLMDADDRDMYYAYIWRDDIPAPAPSDWRALQDSELDGDYRAARDCAIRIKESTGMLMHHAFLRAAVAPSRPCDFVIREWAEGLACDAPETPPPETPPPETPRPPLLCAGCGRLPPPPGRRRCLRCDPRPLIGGNDDAPP